MDLIRSYLLLIPIILFHKKREAIMPHNLNRTLKDAERVQYKKAFFFNASILLKLDIVIISLIVIFCI